MKAKIEMILVTLIKKYLIMSLLFFATSTFSQNSINNSSFNTASIGIYSGINFEAIARVWASFSIEGKTDLTPNLNLIFSVGYHKTYSFQSYTVNSYKFSNIDNDPKYYAMTYNVVKTEYQVLPFSFGLQYIFRLKSLLPYVFSDLSYNFIDPLTTKTEEYIQGEYPTYEDLPKMYKNRDELPNNSYGLSLGTGVIYNISSKIGLDLRYFYKYDSEIINTHHILVGIVF